MDMTMLQRDDLIKCHAHVENFLSKPKFEPLLYFLLCFNKISKGLGEERRGVVKMADRLSDLHPRNEKYN